MQPDRMITLLQQFYLAAGQCVSAKLQLDYLLLPEGKADAELTRRVTACSERLAWLGTSTTTLAAMERQGAAGTQEWNQMLGLHRKTLASVHAAFAEVKQAAFPREAIATHDFLIETYEVLSPLLEEMERFIANQQRGR